MEEGDGRLEELNGKSVFQDIEFKILGQRLSEEAGGTTCFQLFEEIYHLWELQSG